MNYFMSLVSINPGLITTVFNISLFVIIALIILGGIIGLIRGVWNSTFRLIFVGGLVVLTFIFSKDVANALANLNISEMFNGVIIISEKYTVEVTTVKETLNNLLIQVAANNSNYADVISNPNTLALLEEITMMIIRFVTIIVLGILVFVVGDLILSPILYHLLFKLFIPKIARKKVKLRLIGMVEGIIQSTLVICLLITPFSSIINTLNNSMKKDDKTAIIDNELYNEIMSWISAYDESYFAQVLFNWTTDKDGNTFDVNLINYATSDNNLSFNNELAALGDIANAILKSGAISNGEDGGIVINVPILLNDQLVATLISTMIRSEIVMDALPIAAAIALQWGELQEYIDSEKIDLDSIDWEDELSAINTLYSVVYDSGILDYVIYNSKEMVQGLFKEGQNDKIEEALSLIDNSELLSMAIPAVIYKMANRVDEEGNPSALAKFFPLDWESYQGIKFGSELSLIYDCVYSANEVTDFKLIKGTKVEEVETIPPAGFKKAEEGIAEEETILDIVLNNVDELSPIIVGKLDENGEPITDENGLSLPSDDNCLFDSQFLYNAIDKLMLLGVDMIVSNIEGVQLDEEKISEMLESFVNRKDYKREFGSMLNVASDISKEEKINGIFKNQTIDLADEETRQALKRTLPGIDNSKIMSSIIPPVVSNLIQKYDSELEPFGISSSDFDFEVEKFGSEVANLLDGVGSIFSLNDAMKEENVADKIKAINPDDVETLLDTFYSSKILNPNKIVGTEVKKNQNFYKTIDYIFAIDGLEIENITGRIANIDDINWVSVKDDDTITYGENYYIAQFFTSVQNDDIIRLLTESNLPIHDENEFASSSVSELFAKVDESVLISSAFGEVLDRTLIPLLGNVPSGLTFTNVTDWTLEGETLKSVIDGLQDINKAFDQISWLDENPEYINGILTSFASSQAFKDDGFSLFCFEQMKNTIPDFLKDYPSTSGENTFVTAKNDFLSVEDWDSEIDKLTGLISSIQSLADPESTQKGTDGLNKLTNSPMDLSENEINKTLRSLNASLSLRMVMVNSVDTLVSSGGINIATLSLEDTNVSSLLEMDYESREDEITHIVGVYSAIKNMSLTDGFDLKKISSVEIDKLLNSMHDSQLFNTLEDESPKMTIFEQTINTVVEETKFAEKIVQEDQTIQERIQSISNNHASTKPLIDEWVGSDGEIVRICEIFDSYKAMDIDSFELTSEIIKEILSSEEKIDQLDQLLQSVNNSTLFYPGLPNMIQETIDNNAVDAQGLEVNLQTINSYYNNSEKYEPAEITKFTHILKTLNKFNDIKDEEGNKIENPSLGDYDLEILNDLFNELHDSKLFNSEKTGMNGETFFENFASALMKKGDFERRVVRDDLSLRAIIESIPNNNVSLTLDDGWIGEEGEIRKICDMLTQFQNLGLDNADISGVDNLSQEQVYDLISSLNDSTLCYRSVPSYIDDLVATQSVEGIDFKALNSRYNGDDRYDASEIDVLSKIYVSLEDVESLLEQFKTFSSINEDMLIKLENLLKNFYSSQVLHLAGSADESLNTVFEQMMIKLFEDSGLQEMIHDTVLYEEDILMSPKEKSINNIVNYSKLDNGQGSWNLEIERLIDLVRCVVNLTDVDNPSQLDLSTLTPENIKELLVALNKSDLTYYAVPSYVREMFNKIKIDTLSEGKENYLIGRDNYRDNEIGALYILLDGLYNDNEYPNFETFDFTVFVSSGMSSKPILKYLDISDIFSKINGLVFYNAIRTSGFERYVRSEYSIGDRTVFSNLFDLIDESMIDNEGNAIDQILKELNNLIDIDFNSSNFDTNSIVDLFKCTYNGTVKYMFSSEIIAGFMNHKLSEFDLIQDGHTLNWYEENGNKFAYPLQNDVEANGILGALNAKKIATIDINNIATLNVDDFDNCFNLMETNGIKSEIAMAIYVKCFYNPFSSSLKLIYDNADAYFVGHEDKKITFKSNYESLLGDPYSEDFSFIEEKEKIKSCLLALIETHI